MPCYGGDPSPEEMHQSYLATQKHEKEIKDKIDNLTRMLCAMCSAVELQFGSLGEVIQLGHKAAQEITGWYEKHKDWDKKRLEAARKSAIAKLTDEEKEALGL